MAQWAGGNVGTARAEENKSGNMGGWLYLVLSIKKRRARV
jgi:hypothetical protein